MSLSDRSARGSVRGEGEPADSHAALQMVMAGNAGVTLQLSFMQLDDRLCKVLSVHLAKNASLTMLDLALNAIGDSGTKALAAALPACTLVRVCMIIAAAECATV